MKLSFSSLTIICIIVFLACLATIGIILIPIPSSKYFLSSSSTLLPSSSTPISFKALSLSELLPNLTSSLLPKGLMSLNLTTNEAVLISSVVTINCVFCVFCISDLFTDPYSTYAKQFSSSPADEKKATATIISPISPSSTSKSISFDSFSPTILTQGLFLILSTITLLGPGTIYFLIFLPHFFRPWYAKGFASYSPAIKNLLYFVINMSASILLQNVALSFVPKRGLFSFFYTRYLIMIPGHIIMYIFWNQNYKPLLSDYFVEVGSFLVASGLHCLSEDKHRIPRRASLSIIFFKNLGLVVLFGCLLVALDYFVGHSVLIIDPILVEFNRLFS